MPAMVRAIEAGGSCAPLWQALEATGFLELLASEADGGAQLPLQDLFPILCTFGRYATPVWSPRGDLIAFTRFGGESGNFSIGVMHPDGSGERNPRRRTRVVQRGIEVTVIIAGKTQNERPFGKRARDAQRAHHRFGARADEPKPLH